MKNELILLIKAIGTILTSLLKIVRYAIGYTLLHLSLWILPRTRKEVAKATRLSKSKIDYILTPRQSTQSKK